DTRRMFINQPIKSRFVYALPIGNISMNQSQNERIARGFFDMASNLLPLPLYATVHENEIKWVVSLKTGEMHGGIVKPSDLKHGTLRSQHPLTGWGKITFLKSHDPHTNKPKF